MGIYCKRYTYTFLVSMLIICFITLNSCIRNVHHIILYKNVVYLYVPNCSKNGFLLVLTFNVFVGVKNMAVF